MAHLPPSAAIFSPSVARIAASAAKDWKFVDDWLASKFRRTLPPFERNAETLQALLTLASLNEAVDEEHHLVARAESSALRELQAAGTYSRSSNRELATAACVKDELREALQDSLSRDAQASLGAMALLSVELAAIQPTPESLGCKVAEIHARVIDLERVRARLRLMQSNIHAGTQHVDEVISALQGWTYTHAPELARQNLEMQRRLKSMSVKLPDLEAQMVETAANSSVDRHPTIDDLVAVEADHLVLLGRKNELEAQVAQFSGLPGDTEAARGLLDQFRSRLRSQTHQRDALFEGLVERESPRKTY